MSGLARILLSKKIKVSGSDIASSSVTEGLMRTGATVHLGHDAKHITSGMMVIYSTDVKPDNPEFQAAKQLKCPMIHRSDLLLLLMQEEKGLAVAGTHGKTTTSALLTTVLSEGGFDPSYAVGGVLANQKTNAGHGNGEYFVAEADESDGSFVKYSPYGAIVTNIDLDHMDHFGTEEALIDEFRKFMSKVQSKEHLFWCGDDSRLTALKMAGVNYGFSESCALKASHFSQEGWTTTFDIDFKGKHYSQVKVNLTGHHNALNALAVFGMAISLGVSESDIRKALIGFQGVGRRCEKKGEINGITLLDDYAHHPTEILTTLRAIRHAIGERRLIAVYQPHRYSRTQLCLGTVGGIFDMADHLVITDIYGSREAPIPGLSHEQVLQEVKGYSDISCRYIERSKIAEELLKEVRRGDVVVSLGAGDITKLSLEIMSELRDSR